MSKLVISLNDKGEVYRDGKLIATVKGGEISFKHYSYKKHRDEIEYLLGDIDDEPESEIIAETVSSDEEPVTPLELFETPAGKWHGEEAPDVVIWRSKNWSKDAFRAKYAHQEELLCSNFASEGLKFDIKF